MTEPADEPLPEFLRPPLREVAISLQSDPIPGLTAAHLGVLWQRYQDRFPLVEQHAPLEPTVERFGLTSKAQRGPQISLLSQLPVTPRLWFLDNDGHNLIQVQHDRFIRNWRKVQLEDEYPRYMAHLRPKFVEEFEQYLAFLSEAGFDAPNVNQCEVSYFNLIQGAETWSDHSQFATVSSMLSPDYRERAGLEVESASFQVRHVIRNASNERVGRLHIEMAPGRLTGSDEPVYELRLIARGKPDSSASSEVLDFIDAARAHIVRAFANVTTHQMHEAWGLQ